MTGKHVTQPCEAAAWGPEPRYADEQRGNAQQRLRKREHIVAMAQLAHDEASEHQRNDQQKEKQAIKQIDTHGLPGFPRRRADEQYEERNKRECVAYEDLERRLDQLIREKLWDDPDQ